MKSALLFLVSVLSALPAFAGPLEPQTKQLIVSIAPTWDSTQGTLRCFELRGGKWVAVSQPIPALFGKNGLAWGIGLNAPQPGLQKKERDGRAPAGVFAMGKIYTYDASLPSGADYPFRTVGLGDAWVDDVTNPKYNQHVVVDPANPPEWFEKQKMRHNDFAYRWLVEIRHNSDPPQAGMGSAIFFHIRRGETRPSAGCTTLAESDLVWMVKWLRASERPAYVLLPKAEYLKVWKAWNLPDPSLVGGS